MMKSRNHFPKDIQAIGYDEIENSLGPEFSILTSRCKREYGQFAKCLETQNLNKAKSIWTDVFLTRKDDFIKILRSGKKHTEAKEFAASSFLLAALVKDKEIADRMESILENYDCEDSDIPFQKARYYAVTDQKEEMLESIRDCLIMGSSKSLFLEDEYFQVYFEDSDFTSILDRYHEIDTLIQNAIETLDFTTFENILTIVPSFLTLQILTPKGSAAYLPEAAAWHLYTREDLETIELMRKIIQKTPNPVLGECLVRLASENEYIEPFRFLLECGADPNTKNWEGYTALGRAKGNGCGKTVAYLMEKKEHPSLPKKLVTAIEAGIQKFSLEHADKTVAVFAVEDGVLSFAIEGENLDQSGSWKYQGYYEIPEESFDRDAYENGDISPDVFREMLEDLNRRGVFETLNRSGNFKYLFLEHVY
ncbi:ankyrin repeat domain-containing protein [Leptospira sp. 201903071]|uniref:ankyrin repeat domain-containing protein n=1 Tax=Leptospira ainazelensis TaxID=2810034 RepID=UPI001964A720|nr:ankyrin repeat domain-containing protein [Leptospira ainazelensis]MBM9501663.1 ankyrin repeat domain-containing protein [Leptospira ainazelensis]